MADLARPEPPLMTLAEFLEWDDGTDQRYELVDGVITGMAAPSVAHSTIAGNIAVALGRNLLPPCRVRVEHGLELPDSDRDYRQADLTVVCADLRPGTPLPDPLLIVEVSSRSSLDHDRGRKRDEYQRLAGCQSILIVESERRHVERWTRDGERWIVQSFIGERGPVAIEMLGISVDLEEIYAGIEL